MIGLFRYSRVFSIPDRLDLMYVATPKTANTYRKYKKETNFDFSDILFLIKTGIPYDLSKKYPDNFSGEAISAFYHSGFMPEDIFKYKVITDHKSIISLLRFNVSEQEALKYLDIYYSLSGQTIGLLINLKIGHDEIDQNGELIQELQNLESFNVPKFINGKKFAILGKGASGVIFLVDNKVWKILNKKFYEINYVKETESISRMITNFNFEDTYFNMLKECKYIVKLINTWSKIETWGYTKSVMLEFEYITGDSIENILNKGIVFPSKKVIQYGLDIMNGLIEMRKAGIFYHRDIRPANVMINSTNDRAMIIDLGIASDNRRALPKDNRRYGGPNDLTSLSQLLYKMNTGNHLFAQSQSMEKSVFASKLKDQRDTIFNNSGKIQYYLGKIDKNIRDLNLRYIIKFLLVAKNHEYKKALNEFNLTI